jgi:predicted outer membrane repeat protein
LAKNLFEGNTAKAGGAIYMTLGSLNKNPAFKNIYYDNKGGFYGPNSIESPRKLTISYFNKSFLLPTI